MLYVIDDDITFTHLMITVFIYAALRLHSLHFSPFLIIFMTYYLRHVIIDILLPFIIYVDFQHHMT